MGLMTVETPKLAPEDAPVVVHAPTVRVLPTPPREDELGVYEHREVALLAGVSAVSIACLAVSQARFVQLNPWLIVVLPALVFTLAYYLASLAITMRSRNFDLAAHRQRVADWKPATYPSVDILLPICNEGLDVLTNTWDHVSVLAKTYKGDVVVHVLDDGDSPRAAAAAASYSFVYKVRPNRGWLKKAGNLRHGYLTSSNTYVVIFDADFCPRPDFLDQLLPYAEADPSLGIVQSPQYFRVSREQTVMERGAAAVQELFYRMIQVSRGHLGAAICVGSCAVYRRTALDEIGGTALIEHSEDVHTGFELGQAGWGLAYVPVPLATGLCPEDPDSFLTQQYRWCAGSMAMLTSRSFWAARLPARERLCYLSGFFYYLHTAVFVVVTPAIPLLLIATEPSHVVIANYVWILPSTLYALVVFPLWNRIRYGPSALMAKYLYGWAHLFAVIDTMRGGIESWQVTGSGDLKQHTDRIWWGIRIWGLGTSAAWLGGAAWRATEYGAVNWLLMLFAGGLYAAVIGMALRARRSSVGVLRRVARVVACVAVAAAMAACESPGTSQPAATGTVEGPIALTLPASLQKQLGIEVVPAASSVAPVRNAEVVHPKQKFYGVAVAGAPHSLARVDAVTKQLHQAPKVVEYFQDWTHEFDAVAVQKACNAGMVPAVTWESWSWQDLDGTGTAASQPAYAPRKIANGRYDDYVRRTARAVKSVHCPIVMRLDQEPNGRWYPWGLGTPGMHNTAGQYVAMWRHVWRVFHRVHARNVVWMWSPNYLYPHAIDKLGALYPGNRYVDTVGIDGYLAHSFDTPSGIFGPVMSRLSSVAPSKPWLIAETAAVAGKSQPSQIRALLRMVANDSRLTGLVYLDQVTGRANWLFGSRPASVRAFRRGIADPAFRSGAS